MNSRISVIGLVPALTLFAAVDLAAQSEFALEEIIVTAQKREQSLQEVPVSVTAITGEDITEGGITGMQDVAMATPNFTMTQFNIGEPQYFIRGIGTTLDSAGADPAVATFIDEVYIGRAGGSSMDLYDLQRVEVLRGPQGTLFGKNVVGGAISISTQKPSDEFIAKFGITAGNYDALAVRGLISGSISDTVNGSLSFSQRKHDGYVENVVDSTDYHDQDNISFRGQLAFAPSDSVEVRLVADYSKDDQAGNCRNVNNLSLNDPLMLAVVYPPVIDSTTGGDIRKCASSLGAFQDREINGLMARIDWDLANATLTSITAYRETDYQWSEDLAGMPFGLTPFNLIDAAEAKRLDLVNEVVPASDLDEAVRTQAETIAKLPAVTVQYNKKLINMAYELMGVRQVLDRSMELEAVALASPNSSPEIARFQELRGEEGLNAALAWNAERFEEEDAWFRKR